jgi:DNA-binding winged helix-turn-helix (wHTH) protein
MIYRFSDCELDTEMYTLHRAGQRIPLRPKALHMLRVLLEVRHRVVSKEELCAAVWPNQAISDATLSSTLRAIRQAVGDSGEAQRHIYTLPGYGYRFIAAVVQDDPALGRPCRSAGTASAGDASRTAAAPPRAYGGTACGYRYCLHAPPADGVAEPNTVVISDTTARLVGDMFLYQDLGPHMLPSMAEPVYVYRVLGASGMQHRLKGSPRRRFPRSSVARSNWRCSKNAGSVSAPGRDKWCW